LDDPELCIWRLAGMTIGVLAIILPIDLSL
jgi:hypothetical protein